MLESFPDIPGSFEGMTAGAPSTPHPSLLPTQDISGGKCPAFPTLIYEFDFDFDMPTLTQPGPHGPGLGCWAAVADLFPVTC